MSWISHSQRMSRRSVSGRLPRDLRSDSAVLSEVVTVWMIVTIPLDKLLRWISWRSSAGASVIGALAMRVESPQSRG
jgi:hypothetical protein